MVFSYWWLVSGGTSPLTIGPTLQTITGGGLNTGDDHKNKIIPYIQKAGDPTGIPSVKTPFFLS